MESKICSKCKINKLHIEFNKRKSTKDGYRSQCKECEKRYAIQNTDAIKQQRKQYRLNTKDRAKQYSNQYRIKNKDKIIEKRKEWRINNKDKISKSSKQYFINNRDKIHQYFIDNKDKIIDYKKQYYIDNKDKIKINRKEYHKSENGKLILKSSKHKRRALIKNNTPLGKHWTPSNIIEKMKLQQGKCIYCEISIKDAYEIDHIIALVKGGSNEASNIQLLCKKCNRTKHDKLPYEFAPKHGKLF